MAKYFNFFPLTEYRFSEKESNVIATKITSRFSFDEKLKENSIAYYEYIVKDGETPEMLAHRFYGSSEKHWIILLMNDIVNPLFDWVLDERTFNEYVKNKYSAEGLLENKNGLEWARTNTHSYYKVISQKIQTKTIVTELQIDEATYNALTNDTNSITLPDGNTITETTTKKVKSYFEYERDINESRRNIKVLKLQFLDIAQSQFESIFNE
jgi:hypothetical protein